MQILNLKEGLRKENDKDACCESEKHTDYRKKAVFFINRPDHHEKLCQIKAHSTLPCRRWASPDTLAGADRRRPASPPLPLRRPADPW